MCNLLSQMQHSNMGYKCSNVTIVPLQWVLCNIMIGVALFGVYRSFVD